MLGIPDPARQHKALQGLLPSEEVRAAAHLVQNEPKAGADTDVVPSAVK